MIIAQLDESAFAQLEGIVDSFTSRYSRDIDLAGHLEELRRGIGYRDTLNTLSALESLDKQRERLFASDRNLLDEALSLFVRPIDEDLPFDSTAFIEKMKEKRAELKSRKMLPGGRLRDAGLALLGAGMLVFGIVDRDVRAILVGGLTLAFCLMFVYYHFVDRMRDKETLETIELAIRRAEQEFEEEELKS